MHFHFIPLFFLGKRERDEPLGAETVFHLVSWVSDWEAVFSSDAQMHTPFTCSVAVRVAGPGFKQENKFFLSLISILAASFMTSIILFSTWMKMALFVLFYNTFDWWWWWRWWWWHLWLKLNNKYQSWKKMPHPSNHPSIRAVHKNLNTDIYLAIFFILI